MGAECLTHRVPIGLTADKRVASEVIALSQASRLRSRSGPRQEYSESAIRGADAATRSTPSWCELVPMMSLLEGSN